MDSEATYANVEHSGRVVLRRQKYQSKQYLEDRIRMYAERTGQGYTITTSPLKGYALEVAWEYVEGCRRHNFKLEGTVRNRYKPDVYIFKCNLCKVVRHVEKTDLFKNV